MASKFFIVATNKKNGIIVSRNNDDRLVMFQNIQTKNTRYSHTMQDWDFIFTDSNGIHMGEYKWQEATVTLGELFS